MPKHNLTTRPAIAKIKHAPGNTIMYSDPSVKPDPDARGIRLAVGATKKTWVLSKRIDGKVRSVTLGAWPDLPTVFAARDVAKEKMEAITTGQKGHSPSLTALSKLCGRCHGTANGSSHSTTPRSTFTTRSS